MKDKIAQKFADKVAERFIKEKKMQVTLETIKEKLLGMLKKVYDSKELNDQGSVEEHSVKIEFQCKKIININFFLKSYGGLLLYQMRQSFLQLNGLFIII